MKNFIEVQVEATVQRVGDCMLGQIKEIGERRPVRARVEWADGSESMVHPEQVHLYAALKAPDKVKELSAWGRSTPQYLISLRKQLRDQRKPSKPNLEGEANKILAAKKNRKRKKTTSSFLRQEKRYRTWLNERIVRDDRHD